MALNIKNPEVERLAAEVARITNESKTEAIRRSLVERKQRLNVGRARASKAERTQWVLENVIWPRIPARLIGIGFRPEHVNTPAVRVDTVA